MTTWLYDDKKRSGRPVKLSKRSLRIIRLMSLRNRTMSVRSITRNFNIQRTEHISHDTVSKILIKYDLRSYRSARSRLLPWSNGEEELSGLVPGDDFSDDPMFQVFGKRSSHQIRRFKYERYSPICTRKVIWHGT